MISDMQREATVALKVSQYMMEMKEMQAQLAGGGEEGGEDPVVHSTRSSAACRRRADLMLGQQRLQNGRCVFKRTPKPMTSTLLQGKDCCRACAVARERIYAPKGG